jgi:Flp pilus assembly protein TadD
VTQALSLLLLLVLPVQDHDLHGYMKGKKLFEGTVSVKGAAVATGIRGGVLQEYILRIEGTVSTPGGRQADAFYRFVDPHDDTVPRPGGPLSVLYGSETVYRSLPLVKNRPKYRSDHVYEVLIRPENREGEIKLVAPDSWHDYPRDKPADHYSGSVQVEIYEAVPDDGLTPKLRVSDAKKVGNDVSFLARGGGASQDQLERVFSDAPLVKGIAADGVSMAVLTMMTDKPGTATFKVEGVGGGLYPIGSGQPIFQSPGVTAVHVSTVPLKSGKHGAVALYRPPSYFGKGTKPKEIKFSVSFGAREGSVSVDLVRPPVVLVHGTYDNPGYCYNERSDEDDAPMNLAPLLRNLGYEVWCVDWEETNGSKDPSDFETNRLTVWRNKDGLKTAIETMRNRGIAVTQADVVCHSQGGVITRVYARGYPFSVSLPPTHPHYTDPDKCVQGSDPCWYHRADNYNRGDIHRSVTISTTHRGSHCCNLFPALAAYPDDTLKQKFYKIVTSIFLYGVDKGVTGITTGGFLNQVPDSLELQLIGPTPVPAHAIACVATDEDMKKTRVNSRAGVTLNMGDYYGKLFLVYAGTPDDAKDFAFDRLAEIAEKRGVPNARQMTEEYKRLNAELTTAKASARDQRNNQGQEAGKRLAELQDKVIYQIRKIVFQGDENDCTVSLNSSWGLLQAPYVTKCENVLHGWAPRYRNVQRKVVELLVDDGRQFDHDGFPGYSGIKSKASSFIAPIKPLVEGPMPALYEGADKGPGGGNLPPPGTVSLGPAVPAEVQGPWSDAAKRYGAGDMKGAAQTFKAAVETLPKNAMLRSQYAVYLSAARRFKDATAQMREAVKLEPDNAPYRAGYGRMLLTQSEVQKAAEQFSEALRLKPDLPDGHAGLGQVAILQGRYVEAERSLREAIRLAPNVSAYQALVGNSLAFQNRWEEAEKFFAESIRLNPNDAQGQAGMGSAMFGRGRFAEAESHLKRAIQLDGSQAMYRANLAQALLRQGKKNEALFEAYFAIGMGLLNHPVYKELGIIK